MAVGPLGGDVAVGPPGGAVAVGPVGVDVSVGPPGGDVTVGIVVVGVHRRRPDELPTIWQVGVWVDVGVWVGECGLCVAVGAGG